MTSAPVPGHMTSAPMLDDMTGATVTQDPGVPHTDMPDTNLPDIRTLLGPLVPELRAFARFLVRDRVAADDLVQDAVVRALAAAGQFIPGTSLRSWMFTILRNAHYEQGRRRRAEQRVLERNGPPPESHAPPQPDRAALSELQRFIWKLPPTLREALVLVGAQGLSYEEAAVVCGVPEGTVKARVSRARQRLAAAMGRVPAATDDP